MSKDPIYYLDGSPSRLLTEIGHGAAIGGQWLNQLPHRGYVLISLSAYGSVLEPHFAAVWVPKTADSKPQRFLFGPDGKGLDVGEAVKQVSLDIIDGYAPSIVAVVGDTPYDARYFFVLEYDQDLASQIKPPDTESNLFPWLDVELKDLYNFGNETVLDGLRQEKYIIRWACFYGTLERPYLALVIQTNPPTDTVSPIAWSYESGHEVDLFYRQVDAYAQGGVRPALVALLAGLKANVAEGPWDVGKQPPVTVQTELLSLWYDDVIFRWDPGYSINYSAVEVALTVRIRCTEPVLAS